MNPKELLGRGSDEFVDVCLLPPVLGSVSLEPELTWEFSDRLVSSTANLCVNPHPDVRLGRFLPFAITGMRIHTDTKFSCMTIRAALTDPDLGAE